MAIDPLIVPMIGFPNTGKTTFLAALWHVVKNHDEVPGALYLKVLNGEKAYLTDIHKRWCRFKEVDRTKRLFEGFASMDLAAEMGPTLRLEFSDVSGEHFQDQIKDRECLQTFADQIKRASGVLVFLHAARINEPTSINDFNNLSRVIEGKGDNTMNKPPSDPKPWDISCLSTQAQVVELLQFLQFLRAESPPLRVSLVISAWDCVTTPSNSPSGFIRDELPQLDQYLKAWGNSLPSRVYGVSAQGGSLENEDKANDLAKKTLENPSSRIKVAFDGTPDSHDITEPIKWFLDPPSHDE